jgi:hypothetical protein
MVPMNRSATAFARGARAGVLMIFSWLAVKTASNARNETHRSYYVTSDYPLTM